MLQSRNKFLPLLAMQLVPPWTELARFQAPRIRCSTKLQTQCNIRPILNGTEQTASGAGSGTYEAKELISLGLKDIKWLSNRNIGIKGGAGTSKPVIGIGTMALILQNCKGEVFEFDIPNVRIVEVTLLKPQELYEYFGLKVEMYCTRS